MCVIACVPWVSECVCQYSVGLYGFVNGNNNVSSNNDDDNDRKLNEKRRSNTSLAFCLAQCTHSHTETHSRKHSHIRMHEMRKVVDNEIVVCSLLALFSSSKVRIYLFYWNIFVIVVVRTTFMTSPDRQPQTATTTTTKKVIIASRPFYLKPWRKKNIEHSSSRAHFDKHWTFAQENPFNYKNRWICWCTLNSMPLPDRFRWQLSTLFKINLIFIFTFELSACGDGRRYCEFMNLERAKHA